MQNVLENVGDAAAATQKLGLVSTIFREYRNNFGLFWRVMLPIIIVSLVFNIALFLFFKLSFPESQWIFSTSDGVAASHGALHTSPPQSADVGWGMKIDGSSVHIGFLWLAMCPLAFAIVQCRNGVKVTFKAVWQSTLRKTVPILGVTFLIGLLLSGAGIPLVLGLFIFEPLFERFITSYASILIFLFWCLTAIAFVLTVYFMVKWSLYNQGIIIENLPAIAALRRSSELVRGAWGRFFGMYLLLAWASTIFTAVMLGLTLALLSFAVPEFAAPMREMFQPGKFLSLFFFGYRTMTLESAPSFWTIGAIVGVNTLIHAILAPIWAILTTHLYMERMGVHEQQVPA